MHLGSLDSGLHGTQSPITNCLPDGQQDNSKEVMEIAHLRVPVTLRSSQPNHANNVYFTMHQGMFFSKGLTTKTATHEPIIAHDDNQAAQGYIHHRFYWISNDTSVSRDNNAIADTAIHEKNKVTPLAEQDDLYATHTQPTYYGPAYPEWVTSDIHAIASASQALYAFGRDTGYFTEALISEARRTGNLDLAMQNLAGRQYSSVDYVETQIAVGSYPSIALQHELAKLKPTQQAPQVSATGFANKLANVIPDDRVPMARESKPLKPPPNDRVIIIYHGDKDNNLGFRDAQNMAALYRYLGYAPEQITQLRSPTRQQLALTFAKAREQGGKIDFYAATHGSEALADNGIDMRNAPEGTGQGILQLGDGKISEQELYNLFGEQTGRIILDTCHSGAFMINNDKLPQDITATNK